RDFHVTGVQTCALPIYPSTLIVPNVIDGQERESSHTFASRSPSQRDDVVTLAPLSSKEEVREACQKSRAAQRAWARTPAPGRAQIGRASCRDRVHTSRE